MSNTSSTLMTEGSIWKRIVTFAFPLFWGNLFQQLYNTADSLIVGNFLGDSALAAVSSSGSLIFLMVGFFNGIAIGAGVVIARYFGARDIANLQKSIHTTIAFGLICGCALTVLGVFAAPQILVWMGTPSAVLPNSITYFRIYFSGSLAFVMYNFFVGILQSVGDSRHPLIYLIISSAVNIILDLVLIGIFRYGVGAAAFATVISQFISVTLCLRQLLHSPDEFRLSFRDVRLDTNMLRQILSTAVHYLRCERVCSGKYQPVWSDGRRRMRSLLQDTGLWLSAYYLLLHGAYHLHQPKSWSRKVRPRQKRVCFRNCLYCRGCGNHWGAYLLLCTCPDPRI